MALSNYMHFRFSHSRLVNEDRYWILRWLAFNSGYMGIAREFWIWVGISKG